MYCRNCGEKLNDNDRVCPACGTPVNNTHERTYGADNGYEAPKTGTQYYNNGTSHQEYSYSGPEYQGSADTGSIGWGFLGCCIPLVGLILFLVWKDTKPLSAKKAGIGAIIGVVCGLIIYLLLIAMGIGIGALGLASGEFDMSELEQIMEESIRAALHEAII